MEKKKLLLVAISVGVFLAITIGAAILVFTPGNAPAPSGNAVSRAGSASGGNTGVTVTPPPSYYPPSVLPEVTSRLPEETGAVDSAPASADPVGLVRNSGDVPGLEQPPEGSSGEGADYYVSGSARPDGEGGTVITVPQPSAAAVPNAAPAKKAASVSAAPKPVIEAAPKPAPAVSPVPAAKPAPQTKIYDDYWVQTGAFSTINTAEGVKETLASKGITSIIENREVEGRTLFRVRVGPYTSQNEANYWLSLIKSIGGFEDSQVRLTQSRR